MTTDLPLASATQITLFTECQRKWAFRYIERVETPSHPSALLGTEVHDEQLDPYLNQGRPFDFSRPSGEIANALVPLLPRPMTPGMRTKRKFVIPSPTGLFAYQGEIDLYATDSACVPGLVGGVPLLGDFKTTSNLAYAKTSAALRTDIQAQLYAMALLFEDGGDALDAVWFYARTRKPHRVQRTYVRLDSRHVAGEFSRIDAIACEAVAIKGQRPKTEELPPNVRMCEQYGGCPYRNRCNLSPAVMAAGVNEVAVMEQKSSAWIDELRKKKAGNGTVTTPTTDPNTTGAALPPGHFVVHAAGAEASHQPGVHPQPTALPAWATAKEDPLKAQQAERAAARAGAPVVQTSPFPKVAQQSAPQPTVEINPPESALPPAPPIGAAAPAAETSKAKRGRPAKPTQGAASGVTVAQLAEATLLADDFPRAEFATFLRAWADRLEASCS